MKIPKFGVGETLLGLSVAGLVLIATILAARWLEPVPLEFKAFEVETFPPAMVAATVRQKTKCTNGIQADIMDGDGSVTRLPVPAREIDGAISRYPLVIPEGTPAGRYQLQVRESFICPGRDAVIVASPWLPLQVYK